MLKKKKKTKIGFFISDDGFGHAVRQSSIIKELLNQKKKILKSIFLEKVFYQKSKVIFQIK